MKRLLRLNDKSTDVKAERLKNEYAHHVIIAFAVGWCANFFTNRYELMFAERDTITAHENCRIRRSPAGK